MKQSKLISDEFVGMLVVCRNGDKFQGWMKEVESDDQDFRCFEEEPRSTQQGQIAIRQYIRKSEIVSITLGRAQGD